MNENGYLRRFGGDNIALLGLFIVALFSAYLIVNSKSSVMLSEPIELPYTGLSVSVPHGNGWQSGKRWTFLNNAYTIGSSFAFNNRKPSAWALCRYRLAAATVGPQEWFEQRALEIDGRIVTTEHTETGSFVIDSAQISSAVLPINMLLGTVRLPNNHQFDIEIHENAGDVILAEETFSRMIDSIKFEGNRLSDIGADIISDLKSEEISGFLSDKKQQTFLFIDDAKRRTIGFEMVIIVAEGGENQFDIKAASMLYIRGPNAQEQIASFVSDDRFDEYTWKSEASGPDGTSSAELVLGSDGLMTVKKIGFGSLENSYRLSTAAVPDILLDFFFIKMLERSQKQARVDMVKSDGKITPTLITRVENEQESNANDDAAYVLKLDFLDGSGASEKLYLNSRMRVFERFVQLDEPYIFRDATIEQVMKEFPERAQEILESTSITRKDLL